MFFAIDKQTNILYNQIMKANKELWNYGNNENVWVGKYLNSQNLLHWHNDCELILVENGSAYIICGKDALTAEQGDSLFIDGGSLHHIHALEPNTVILTIVFKRSLINDFAERLTTSSPRLLHKYPIEETYSKILLELKKKSVFYNNYTDLHLKELMLDIFRSEELSVRKFKVTDENLKSLFEKVDSDLEFISFDDAARHMNMNASYFSKYFKLATGISFSGYLNTVRVQRAISLLQADNRNMTEISLLCGFGSIRNFNRIFKQLTGFSPRSLPEGYTFRIVLEQANDELQNPTLPECFLLESSSD